MTCAVRQWIGLGLVLGVWGLAQATPVSLESARAVQTASWVPVSDEVLGASRGGFELDLGLKVSFGFMRHVSVNGNVVASTGFNLPDVGAITQAQVQAVSAALAESGLVQVGAGNQAPASLGAQLPTSTVIQNSLSNQNIQSLTVINTGVNSQSLIRALNIQSTLNDALLGSLRLR